METYAPFSQGFKSCLPKSAIVLTILSLVQKGFV